MNTFGRRLSWASFVVFAAALIASAPAAAATGQYGVHVLVDSGEYPAVRCIYDAGQQIVSVRVRPPFVAGYDRTAGPDPQTVGWRFRVQYDDTVIGTPGWTTAYTSTIVRKRATDHRNAAFTARSHMIAPSEPDHIRWRVLVDVRWYFPDDVTRTGAGTLVPVFYAARGPAQPPTEHEDSCPGSMV